MSKVLKSSNKFLMRGGRWLTREEYVPPPPPLVTRYVYLNQSTGGTISASPMSGHDGDTVTLSNTPSTNYTFDGYTVNGATLYSGNKFDFSGSDVTCSASWTLNLPAYTMRLRYRDGVTPTFSKGTGTRVSTSPNVWDLKYSSTDWTDVLNRHTDLLEVIAGNTTGITNFTGTFYGCSSLTTVALFDTSTVTQFASMFAGCSSITSVPLFNLSNGRNCGAMFYQCTNLTSVPKFNTSKVGNMTRMFYECYNLTTVPLLDTSEATSMNGMFQSCTGLTTVPLLDTSKVTNMLGMFHSCGNLKTIPLFNTSSCTDMEHMFVDCENVESGARPLYNQASNQAHVPKHDKTFRNCGTNTASGRYDLAYIPSSWK